MEETKVRTLTDRERQERISMMLTGFLGVLLFFMSFYVVYHLSHDLSSSDYTQHIGYADEYNKGTLILDLLMGENSLWHSFVWVLMRLGMQGYYACSLVTALAIVAVYILNYSLLRDMLRQIRGAVIPVASFVTCVVGPLYVPWFSTEIYRGQSSPNIWHNPTQLMVRPFAIVGLWMTVRIYQRLREGNWEQKKVYQSRKELTIYTVVLACSSWAKPNFLQGFIPALAIVMLVDIIRTRGKAFISCFKIAMAFVPGTLLMFMRFFRTFFTDAEGGGGVEFAPFDVWSKSTTSIPISMLLLFAFPIFVLLIVDRKRYLSSVEGQVSLGMVAVSTAMKALLAETGYRRYHGNMGWCYGLASSLVWLIAMRNFLDLMYNSDRLTHKQYKIVSYIGWTLLAMHFLVGIIYYCHIATGTVQC